MKVTCTICLIIKTKACTGEGFGGGGVRKLT